MSAQLRLTVIPCNTKDDQGFILGNTKGKSIFHPHCPVFFCVRLDCIGDHKMNTIAIKLSVKSLLKKTA